MFRRWRRVSSNGLWHAGINRVVFLRLTGGEVNTRLFFSLCSRVVSTSFFITRKVPHLSFFFVDGFNQILFSNDE